MKKFSRIVENQSEKLTKETLEDYLQEIVDIGFKADVVERNGGDYHKDIKFSIYIRDEYRNEDDAFEKLSDFYGAFGEFMSRFRSHSGYGFNFPQTNSKVGTTINYYTSQNTDGSFVPILLSSTSFNIIIYTV